MSSIIFQISVGMNAAAPPSAIEIQFAKKLNNAVELPGVDGD
jgi:hypothetical protein